MTQAAKQNPPANARGYGAETSASAPAAGSTGSIRSPQASSPQAASGLASARHAPYDVEDLLGRCLGDPAFLEKVLNIFRNRARAMLQELEQAIADDDRVALSRAAHGIKGAAANLSAGDVRDLAARLEDLPNSGCLDTARRYCDEMRERLQECIDYIPRAVSDAVATAKQVRTATRES